MIENIKIVCGEYGDLKELESIESNPNFIFENDPNYETITLFNENGNIINVNSWLECANYVNGGWISDKIDLINGEQILFYVLTSVIIITFLISKIKSKRSFYSKN